MFFKMSVSFLWHRCTVKTWHYRMNTLQFTVAVVCSLIKHIRPCRWQNSNKKIVVWECTPLPIPRPLKLYSWGTFYNINLVKFKVLSDRHFNRKISFFFFFTIWVLFHDQSHITEMQEKGEDILLTPHYYFHPLHRHLKH